MLVYLYLTKKVSFVVFFKPQSFDLCLNIFSKDFDFESKILRLNDFKIDKFICL